MSIAPGTRLGPFDVTAPLGAGGMGQVFRAHDSRLNRDVAIKVLPPEFATDPERMARFEREAQVLASLNHPNIAAIYGLEESGGATALVMELVEGQTLGERIEAGTIPRGRGARHRAADRRGARGGAREGHHPPRPEAGQLKITPEGKVKVLDFGLAKAMDADPISGSGSQPNAQTLTLDSTRAGQILGTAAYMSPEQARGKPVDKRADIWAFGVVLYEMLTGKSMFEGETVSDTLAAVLRADIDLKHLPADTPPKLRRLLQRCLERDPKRRLRDIGDAWIELDAPDAPAGRRRCGAASAEARGVAAVDGRDRARGRGDRVGAAQADARAAASGDAVAGAPKGLRGLRRPIARRNPPCLYRRQHQFAADRRPHAGPVRRQAAARHRWRLLPEVLARRPVDRLQHDAEQDQESARDRRRLHHAVRRQFQPRRGMGPGRHDPVLPKGTLARPGQRRDARDHHEGRRQGRRDRAFASPVSPGWAGVVHHRGHGR